MPVIIKALRCDVGKTPEVIDLAVGLGIEGLRSILGDFDSTLCAHGMLFCGEWSLHEDPINTVATRMWWHINPSAHGTYPLHGTVIFTGPPDAAGYETSFGESFVFTAQHLAGPTPADLKWFGLLTAEWQDKTRAWYLAHGKNRG